MDLERNQVRKEVAKEFEEKVGSEPEETRQYYFPANDRFRVGEIVPLVVKISDAKEEIQIRLNDKSVPYGRIEKGNLFIYLIKPHEPGEIKFAYPDEDIEKSIGSEGPKAFPAFVER